MGLASRREHGRVRNCGDRKESSRRGVRPVLRHDRWPQRTHAPWSRFFKENPGIVTAATTVLGIFIAASATLLAAWIGQKGDTAAAEDEASTLQQQVENLEQDLVYERATVGRRDETIERLRREQSEIQQQVDARDDEIVLLRSQLADLGVVDAEPEHVRHDGQVELADGGDVINVLAPAGDEKWGARPDVIFLAPGDLAYRNGILRLARADAVVLPDGAPTLERCSELTTYTDVRDVEPGTLEQGRYCLRLHDGSFAAIRTLGVEDGVITVRITVWQ
ncbi:hypothetical protein [Georgenia wangjunii]|uniref:hypothetical protein n=1 Tax=Georgenia wangjunii TaxID=3117730 RepID=UPI002F26DAB6